ncbi:hypothetical protein NMG60_11030900, partial [Bertholletia excelsa]
KAREQPENKSFRDEDYSNRRVFLRSYPLHWGGGEEEEGTNEEETAETSKGGGEKQKKKKKPIKKLMVSVFQWGERRVLVFRKLKHKVAIYVIACLPAVGFKPPTVLITT